MSTIKKTLCTDFKFIEESCTTVIIRHDAKYFTFFVNQDTDRPYKNYNQA